MNSSISKQFAKTDNPIEMDLPVEIPSSTPTVVQIMVQQAFGHAQSPVSNEVFLPSGTWGKVILTITGTQAGRQFDRLMQVWADNTQIFVGCTPEPSKEGIQWKIQKDITTYLPVLIDEVSFTVNLENYLDELHTGIPLMSVSLEFYPAVSIEPAQRNPLDRGVPDNIVPITVSPQPHTVNKEGIMEIELELPDDMKELYLDLYAIAQNNDEFWWSNSAAFREIEIYIDQIPAGSVWPEIVLYTGGINPLLWRPVTAIRTMNMPPYRVNLTPFAGLLGGKHMLTIKVVNGVNYWLMSGSMFLYRTNGSPTTGKITKNTLAYTGVSSQGDAPMLGSEENKFTNEEAGNSYQIEGVVETSEGSYVSSVSSSYRMSNDQTNYETGHWQLGHNAQVVITDENLSGPGGKTTKLHREITYTADSAMSYLHAEEPKAMSISSNFSQTITELQRLEDSDLNEPYRSHLYMNTQGYAVLQRSPSQSDVTDGSTTCHIDFKDSNNKNYQRTIMTHGGVETYRSESDNMFMTRYV
ncbi:peptide-N4-asparagine amidase [Paenibacillus marinisediminis]